MERGDFTYRKRLFLILALSCFFPVLLYSQSTVNSEYKGKVAYNDSLLAKIDFQRGFNNDTLVLKVNCNTVFKNVIATSHSLSDFTGHSVEVMYLTRDEATIFYKKKKIKLVLEKNILAIEIGLNGHYSRYNIKLTKGKFIGLRKTKDNKLELIQIERRFAYD